MTNKISPREKGLADGALDKGGQYGEHADSALDKDAEYLAGYEEGFTGKDDKPVDDAPKAKDDDKPVDEMFFSANANLDFPLDEFPGRRFKFKDGLFN